MKNLIDKVAEKLETTKKDAKATIEFLFQEVLNEAKAEGKIKIGTFGTFAVKTKKERKARNPKTGEEIIVPEKTVLAFKQIKDLIE